MATTYSSNDFLGKGWSFPPSFVLEIGSVKMEEQQADIEQSLHILLTTTVGERVMQPKYGCNMDTLLFEPLNTTAKTIMIDKIKTAILFFEPRIEVQRIELSAQDQFEGLVLVEIDYTVKATNSRFNFVFPYYITEGTELKMLTTTRI